MEQPFVINVGSKAFNYYIGINSIKLKLNNRSLESILGTAHKIQMSFPDSVIQFFNDEYVLDQKHIVKACYFLIRSFNSKQNIASSKNIELLLYLACNRQIKFSLKYFGLNQEVLETGILHYCIIHKLDQISNIDARILAELNCISVKSKLLEKSLEKFNKIKNFFDFTDNQLEVILKSYNIKFKYSELNLENVDLFYNSLNDLICERMTLLSLEKA